MEFYSNCFNESLRIQPPVYFSSSVSMMEDVTVNGYTIQKGDSFSIDMYRLGNNPEEWHEPSRFYPERFERTDKYFKTPAGKNRNPYSFSPFLGGQRVCIDKTLVESISKLTLPTLWSNFDFEFEKGIDAATYKMPCNNLLCTKEPEVNVIITKKAQFVPIHN